MKQPSRKPCTRESLSDHISGDLDQIIEAIAGVAQDVDTDEASRITNVANAVAQQAAKYGLKTRSRWLTDGENMAAVVNVQLGHRRAFPDSEDISIRIYDTVNIKVILTHNIIVSMKNSGEDVEQLTTFNDQGSAIQFLEFVYDRVIAADPNSGSNL